MLIKYCLILVSQIDTSPLTHLGKNSDILFIKKIGYSFLML